jgi:serine/threonine protein kinase
MKFCPQCNGTFDGKAGFCPDDGTVLEAGPPVEVGQVLDGQYEIEAFIARGGMGTLHRARHILLGDRVVIKTLRPEMRSNSEWLRRFQREGQAARRFRHPNAVIVYDLRANSDGLTYMVMEYVEGQTLDKELQQHGRFSAHEALEILEPVARALDMAHTNGVVHRDLKPENVMLSRDANGRLHVKLLDLGIAKLRGVADAVAGGDDGGLTVAGQILGTPYYMSPEQWGARPRDGGIDVDGRTDIYSLGIIFYELCAGHKPFIASTMPEMQQAHLSQEPRPLSAVVPDMPEAFSQAVARAMAKDRNDRFQDVGEFADELRAALDLTIEPRAAGISSSSITVPRVAAGVPPPTQTPARPTAAPAPVSPDAHTIAYGKGSAATSPRARVAADTTAVEAASPTPAAVVTTPPPPPAYEAAAPVVTPPVVTPVKRRSNAPIVAAIVVLLLASVGLGGWYVWRHMNASRVVEKDKDKDGNANGDKRITPPAPVEALSYWVEAFDDAKAKEGRRVADVGALSLRSGQQFRFHFTPRERGYLYIVGPGEGNAPTTFLTARPVGVMKTNLAGAGADFSFPYGAGRVLQLDLNASTEDYTVIFSPTQLLTPAFLAAKAEHELTPAEQAELEALRAQAQTGTPAARVQDTNGAAAVPVTVAATENKGRPLIFDIRIEHH